MNIQKLEDAIGDLNLDLYPVRVTKLPTVNGTALDSAGLLNYIRLHIDDFVDTDLGNFLPYLAGTDDTSWTSSSPAGTVFKIDLAGPDDAAVVTSLAESRRWRFTTVHTSRHGRPPGQRPP